MPIDFRCATCNKLLRTPDESAGKKARCPQCGAIADVPLPGQNSAATTPSVPAASPPNNPPAVAPSSFGAGPAEPAINPYSSPAVSPVVPTRGTAPFGQLLPRRTTLDEILNQTWQIYKNDIGTGVLSILTIIGLSLPIILIIVVGAIISGATNHPAGVIIGYLIAAPVMFVFQAFIKAGSIHLGLIWARKGRAKVGDLFAGGRWFFPMIGFQFLVALLVGALILICMLPGILLLAVRAEEVAVFFLVIGGIVAVSAMIVIAYHLFLTPYFIIDRNAGVIQAIGLSRTYMKGNMLTIFLTTLIVGVVAGLLGSIPCVGSIASLFVYGYFLVFGPIIYLLVTSQPTAAQIGAISTSAPMPIPHPTPPSPTTNVDVSR